MYRSRIEIWVRYFNWYHFRQMHENIQWIRIKDYRPPKIVQHIGGLSPTIYGLFLSRASSEASVDSMFRFTAAISDISS